MTTNDAPIQRLDHVCKGPNPHCRAAFKSGLPVHVIPNSPVWERPADELTIILPTYHYATEREARQAVAEAHASAPVVTCDDDLYAFRARGIAHKLPVGWVDPTRRV